MDDGRRKPNTMNVCNTILDRIPAQGAAYSPISTALVSGLSFGVTMTYAEKLKDPRWQRKRLEIMERDGFKCRRCGEKTKTLHVHHVAYLRGKAPWEHPDTGMLTLCEGCHAIAETTAELFKATLCGDGMRAMYLMSEICGVSERRPTGRSLAQILSTLQAGEAAR